MTPTEDTTTEQSEKPSHVEFTEKQILKLAEQALKIIYKNFRGKTRPEIAIILGSVLTIIEVVDGVSSEELDSAIKEAREVMGDFIKAAMPEEMKAQFAKQ